MNQIRTYLHDHLTGSHVALELVEHLAKRHQGGQLEQFFTDLHRDIKIDQELMRPLIGSNPLKENWFRQKAAWIAARFARLKFRIAGEHVGGLGLVQALETLELVIRGKQLLWRLFRVTALPTPPDVDFVELERRAVEQQERVEIKRITAAAEALR